MALDEHDAVFTPDDDRAPPLRLMRAQVRSARRLRGSAVLEVTSEDARGRSTLLVYFTEPPPLTPGERRSVFNPMRGVEQTAGAMRLRSAARAKRALVEAWAKALRG